MSMLGWGIWVSPRRLWENHRGVFRSRIGGDNSGSSVFKNAGGTKGIKRIDRVTQGWQVVPKGTGGDRKVLQRFSRG